MGGAMKSNWRWMVVAIGLACGCHQTPPPAVPEAMKADGGAALRGGNGGTPGIVRKPGGSAAPQGATTRARPADPTGMGKATAPTTRTAKAVGTASRTTNRVTPGMVRKPGDGDQPQVKPTDARPADPTPIVRSIPPDANREIPLTIGGAAPAIARDDPASIAPAVPATSPHRPALPSRSAHVLDLLDAKGQATPPSSGIGLPEVADGHAPATRPSGTLQVDLSAGHTALSEDPAATMVPLPANANDQRQREQATERQHRAEADRQAAANLNDSLMGVLLGSPPPPPPAPATRPTIQLFQQ